MRPRARRRKNSGQELTRRGWVPVALCEGRGWLCGSGCGFPYGAGWRPLVGPANRVPERAHAGEHPDRTASGRVVVGAATSRSAPLARPVAPAIDTGKRTDWAHAARLHFGLNVLLALETPARPIPPAIGPRIRAGRTGLRHSRRSGQSKDAEGKRCQFHTGIVMDYPPVRKRESERVPYGARRGQGRVAAGFADRRTPSRLGAGSHLGGRGRCP